MYELLYEEQCLRTLYVYDILYAVRMDWTPKSARAMLFHGDSARS